MSKKPKNEANLPSVSKQTAGGVTGAVIGGIVAGPVGAVAGGVAGALVGSSSAKGNQPIKKAIQTIRSASMSGVKAIKAARERHKSSVAKKAALKPVLAKQKKTKPATKNVQKAAKSKVASKPKAKAAAGRAKKKV